MPTAFVKNMRNSLTFRDYAIEKLEHLYETSEDFNQTFSPAYDLNTNQMYFYSKFRVNFLDELDNNRPVLKNQSGLLKSEIISCNNLSVFDDYQGINLKMNKVMLN